MDILNKLRELAFYYQATRQVGHTTAMMEGAKNIDGVIILAHDMKYAQELARRCGKGAVPISLRSLPHGLRGHRKPLLIDNSAMWWLLRGAVEEIESQREEAREGKLRATVLKDALDDSLDIVEAQQRDLENKDILLKSHQAYRIATEANNLRRRQQTWSYRLKALWQVIRERLNI